MFKRLQYSFVKISGECIRYLYLNAFYLSTDWADKATPNLSNLSKYKKRFIKSITVVNLENQTNQHER